MILRGPIVDLLSSSGMAPPNENKTCQFVFIQEYIET